jgi:hypothetical protein
MYADLDRLPDKVRCAVAELEAATPGCTGFQMNICLGYGSRQEIVGACRDVVRDVAAGHMSIHDISEQSFSSRLQTKDIPGRQPYILYFYIGVTHNCKLYKYGALKLLYGVFTNAYLACVASFSSWYH